MTTKAKKQTKEVVDTPTITVNGKTFDIESLPGDIKELIGLYQLWEGELIEARREAFKIEAALKGLTTELDVRLQKFDAAVTATTSTPD